MYYPIFVFLGAESSMCMFLLLNSLDNPVLLTPPLQLVYHHLRYSYRSSEVHVRQVCLEKLYVPLHNHLSSRYYKALHIWDFTKRRKSLNALIDWHTCLRVLRRPSCIVISGCRQLFDVPEKRHLLQDDQEMPSVGDGRSEVGVDSRGDDGWTTPSHQNSVVGRTEQVCGELKECWRRRFHYRWEK